MHGRVLALTITRTLLAGLVLTSCASVTQLAPAPAPAPADDSLEGYAVLAPGAKLLDEPGGVVLFDVPSGPDYPRGTVRALHRRGELIEVETLAPFELGEPCRPGFAPVRDVSLRVWVRIDELEQVSTRALHVGFDDGTALHVMAGTPVVLEGGAPAAFELGGVQVPAPIPADAVDWLFEPQQLELDVDPRQMILADREPVLDGQAISLSIIDKIAEAVIAPQPPTEWPTPYMLIYAWRREGGELLVELDSRCAVIEARVATPSDPEARPGLLDEARRLLPIADDLGPEPPYVSPRSDRYVAKPGATLYWPHGVAAGTATDHTAFLAPGFEHGGRRCFDVGLGSEASLCLDPPDASFTPAETETRGTGGGYGRL